MITSNDLEHQISYPNKEQDVCKVRTVLWLSVETIGSKYQHDQLIRWNKNKFNVKIYGELQRDLFKLLHALKSDNIIDALALTEDLLERVHNEE